MIFFTFQLRNRIFQILYLIEFHTSVFWIRKGLNHFGGDKSRMSDDGRFISYNDTQIHFVFCRKAESLLSLAHQNGRGRRQIRLPSSLQVQWCFTLGIYLFLIQNEIQVWSPQFSKSKNSLFPVWGIGTCIEQGWIRPAWIWRHKRAFSRNRSISILYINSFFYCLLLHSALPWWYMI